MIHAFNAEPLKLATIGNEHQPVKQYQNVNGEIRTSGYIDTDRYDQK